MVEFGEVDCVNLSDDEVNDRDGNGEDKGGAKNVNENGEEEESQDDMKSDTQADCYKKINELTADVIRGLEFGTKKEAYSFYHKYAQYHGFASRKDDVYKDLNGNVVTRQLVCNKAGRRHGKHFQNTDRVKQPKAITRVGCPARLRIRHDHKTLKWKVVYFEDKHNHELAPAEHVHLIPAFRGLSEGDKAQVDSLKLHGVRTCHIMGLMLGQKGGHESVGFTKRDLSNHIDKERRQRVQNGDSVAALSYLQAKSDNDPLYYFKFSKTEEGNLQDLFWCDGISRLDYNVFGDVIAFDSTYKRNKYNKSLVIFCGYNHHKETTIFAAALVTTESAETFVWVLQCLREAMFDKHPKAVVTDGCASMRKAIRIVFPNAKHRLCAWHIQRNVAEHVKDPEGLDDFNLFVYASLTAERFEEKWKTYVEKYSLQDEPWTTTMYSMKSYWAATFMRDKFFAVIRTTSMCEGINSFIKRFLQCKSSLYDYLLNFERAVKEYMHNELCSDFKSTYSEPVITTALCGIEYGAAKLFTRKVFMEIKSVIQDALAIKVIERQEVSDLVMLRMKKFCKNKKEYLVAFHKNEKRFTCDCGFFEYCGIPCCHIITAMKHDDVNEFPTSLVCKRWLKSAKADHVYTIPDMDIDSKKIAMLRRGAMSAACNILTQLCCDNEEDFLSFTEEIYKLVTKIQIRRNPNDASSVFAVGDPAVVRARGPSSKKKNTPKKQRHCSNCRGVGHNIKRCPRLFDKNRVPDIDEGESSVEVDDDTTSTQVNGEGSFFAGNTNAVRESQSQKRRSEGVNSRVRCTKKLKNPVLSPGTQDSVNALNANIGVHPQFNTCDVQGQAGPSHVYDTPAGNFQLFPQFENMKFTGILNVVEQMAKANDIVGSQQ